MTELSQSLNQASIPLVTRREIANALWPRQMQIILQQNDDHSEQYFRYYIRQCHHALIDGGQNIQARTHQDVINMIGQIESNQARDMIRETLRAKLMKRDRSNENDILDATIDLAARLHVMMNISSTSYFISGLASIHWREGSLKDCLEQHYHESKVLGNDGIKFEPNFTAANLERIAGIQVKITDNLADHLRMVDQEDKVVAVFHHVAFLRRQSSDVYPDGLKDETLRTLSLLFPKHDKENKKWLYTRQDIERIDKLLLDCDPLRLEQRQIEKFHFWHDRLVMLKQAYDHSQPATMSQWWFDRRNGVQWYTFWVAIWVLLLTLFFGLVQSIEGALQVYKAFHPAQ